MDKLQKISELMGFPFNYWLTDLSKWSVEREEVQPLEQTSQSSIAFLLNHLMELIINEAKGRPYTDREMSLITQGRISEQEVQDLRSGKEDDPSFSTLLILSEAFDVDPAYWFVSTADVARLESTTLRALKDERNYEILRKGKELPTEEKDVLISMIDQLDNLAEARTTDTVHKG